MDLIQATQMKNNQPSWWTRLTIADGLQAAVVAAAALLRLSDLGIIPLSPMEAEAAWNTWRFLQPGSAQLVTASPAYFSLTALMTAFLGDSDTTARLIPAFFGIGLVCLPFFLRKQLGSIGALITSLLLAFSPILTITSRTANGDSIALFALLLTAVAAVRLAENRTPQWLTTFFAGLGLGLGSSPLFFGGLVGLASLWLLPGIVSQNLHGHLRFWTWWERPFLLKAAFVGGVLFLATSTLSFWYPAGIGAAASLPTSWLAQFRPPQDPSGWYNPILALIRYEPLSVPAFFTITIWGIWSKQKHANLLLIWQAVSLIIMLLQPEILSNTLLFLLPSILLTGLFCHTLFTPRVDLNGLALAGTLTVAEALIIINFARFSRAVVFSPQEFLPVWVMLLAALAALIIITLMVVWDSKATVQGILISLLAVGTVYAWGTAWWLGHYAANDTRERWITEATDDNIRILQPLLVDISRQSTRGMYDLDILASVDSPVLSWYFREFSSLHLSDSLPDSPVNDLIITPVGSGNSFGADYLGADFGLTRFKAAPETPDSFSSRLFDTIRWWLFHDSSQPEQVDRVIIWWRADLKPE